ncbi:DUF6843 domain-containing protein [Cellulophaga baltica]|uniref:DUF6843 domain-containing protein n=1 Tax=Cellulophaga baltica 18 TaxID=1348584 RepID=A0AAU8RIB5_9FLAO|nr:hypothetical protein [Cellulophaga baltica]AIZ42250.1 hypothetical protein M666_12020 [Cellulophaga baltica 18]WFO17347.1 hypothetical protein M601_006470 [Cellulophaga baltica 4]
MEYNAFITASSRRFRFTRVILLIVLSVIFNSCLSGSHIDKELFYIPNGIKGNISILFNCKDGKPKKWKDGKRLYEIPISGVLKTQFKENTGYLLFKENGGISHEVSRYREYAQFLYVDDNYKPVKKINYVPYFGANYEAFLDENQINVTGTNNVIGFGNGKEKYISADYLLFFGDTLDYKKVDLTNKTIQDWLRIENWDTYDYRNK